jgi:hypothetical protein
MDGTDVAGPDRYDGPYQAGPELSHGPYQAGADLADAPYLSPPGPPPPAPLPRVEGALDPGQFSAAVNNQPDPVEDAYGWPATAAALAWLPRLGGNGFGTTDFELNHTWQWRPGESANPVNVTPGGGLHFWSGPPGLDLPPRVYDLYLDISWRFLDRERWGLAGGITPGLYGDFVRFNGDTFQLTGWLLGDWRVTQCWTLVGGVAYVRQLRSHLLPVGGIIWQPNPDTRLELLVPRSRVARRVFQDAGQDFWIYLSGLFGGGAWAVDDGLGGSALVQYSDIRLSLGVERATRGGSLLTCEVGYVFARDISVDGRSRVTPGDTFMLAVGGAF